MCVISSETRAWRITGLKIPLIEMAPPLDSIKVSSAERLFTTLRRPTKHSRSIVPASSHCTFTHDIKANHLQCFSLDANRRPFTPLNALLGRSLTMSRMISSTCLLPFHGVSRLAYCNYILLPRLTHLAWTLVGYHTPYITYGLGVSTYIQTPA